MFIVLRYLMLIICTFSGAIVATILKFDPNNSHFSTVSPGVVIIGGALIGLLIAIFAILIEITILRKVSLRDLLVIVLGLFVGAVIAALISYGQILLPDYLKDFLQKYHTYSFVFTMALYVIFVYIGIVVAVRGKSEFSLFMPQLKYNNRKGIRPIVIDTSAIIDGRVIEVYKTGFMTQKIILPEFVLHELQIVSDSNVPLTRTKGRHGLEILKKLQEIPNINIEVTNIDFGDIKEVDDKLMKLAKQIDATILTVDFNLQQVAKIQQIPCLNIFALANALKTPFMPGEQFNIQIVKEGSEINQGVGYLEDGTMVVVSNAKPFVGERANIELTSMVMGDSGRIFFGVTIENPSKNIKKSLINTKIPPKSKKSKRFNN